MLRALLAFAIAVAPGAADAAEVEFGWSGRVVAVSPALVGSVPPYSGIEVGSSVSGRYVFESTTPDADPNPMEGVYPEAILDWEMRLGVYSVAHEPASPVNGIDVVHDLYLALYQALDGVVATPALPGFPTLDAEVFLFSLLPGALHGDTLPVVPPSLAAWDTTSAGLFSRDTGSSLVDIQLTSLCVGPCPDSDGDGSPDASDNCPYFANPLQTDRNANARGDECECGDQNGDGAVDVIDIVAINLALFDPSAIRALCDANADGDCDVRDMIAVNNEIFSAGSTSTCARQPIPTP